MYFFQEELASLRRQDSLREARRRAQAVEARRARRSHRRARRGHRLSFSEMTRPLGVLFRAVVSSERGTVETDGDCECQAS